MARDLVTEMKVEIVHRKKVPSEGCLPPTFHLPRGAAISTLVVCMHVWAPTLSLFTNA